MAVEDEDTIDHETVELDPFDGLTQNIAAEHVVDPSIQIGALTHRGRVRATNQDHYVVVRRTRASQVMATSVDAEDLHLAKPQHAWLLAVADGLGGHASGEVASAAAIQAILNLSFKLSSWIMQPIDDLKNDAFDRAELYAQAIQRELRELAESNPDLGGMATTVTGAYIFGTTALVVNVGDSRSYLVRANQLNQITRDHSMARELEAAGAPESLTRRYRNMVTRCFSTKMDDVSFDLFELMLEPNDQILLCSDGLSDMLADDEILQVLTENQDLKETTEQLVTEALRAGGKDNITVVLARCS